MVINSHSMVINSHSMVTNNQQDITILCKIFVAKLHSE